MVPLPNTSLCTIYLCANVNIIIIIIIKYYDIKLKIFPLNYQSRETDIKVLISKIVESF